MKLTINKIVTILLVSVVLSLLMSVSGATWTIEGDSVCTDNETWGELCMNPHTLHGPGYAYCNVTMAEDYGNIDFVWGFNTSLERPRSMELYNLHWDNTSSSQFFQNVSNIVICDDICEIGHEYNDIKRNVTYDMCSVWNETTMECKTYEQVTQTVCFDSYEQDGNNYTVTWHNARMKYWTDKTHLIESVNHNWNGMNKWYYIKNISMPADVTKTVRIWIDMPVVLGAGDDTKFFFAAKRTTDTIHEAIAADRFMTLDPWHNASRSHRKTVNVTHVNATGSNLVNYTVFLNISKETEMQTDFDDILFYETDGAAMSFEYENHTASYGLFWVLVPSLTAASDTQFWMYYGNDAATSSSNPENSWNVNCSMVQHLQEAPANDTAGHLDSTSNDNDGTPKNFDGTSTSTTDGTGIVDGADTFDGINDYVDCGSGSSLDVSDAVTVEARIKGGSQVDYAYIVISKNTRWGLHSPSASGLIRFFVHTDASYHSPYSGIVFDNNWHHIVGTYDREKIRLYVDGSEMETGTSETGVMTDATVRNFSISLSDYPFNGTIDQVRVYNRALLVDEINQSYQLVENQTTFVAWGSAEQYSGGTTPVISNVTNGSISATSQWIDWDVNQTAHNRVVYSNESDLTPAWYSNWDNSTAAPNITLSALTASTQYWYQAWSYNTTNTSLSDNSSTLSFTTTSAEDAVWCNNDYAKRINVSVNNTAGSALTDYQVYVNLSSNPINETSLRVYNATSCTLRPHWTENETGGNSYGVWINYSAIAASTWTNNTAIYYDNTAVSSVSNGSTTFEFFDGFLPGGENYGEVADDGIWYTYYADPGWYGSPSATFFTSCRPFSIYYNDTYNRTYIAYGGYNSPSPYKERITYFNHSNGSVATPVTVANNPGDTDAHANPAIAINDSGYIFMFYGSNGNIDTKMKRSSNSEDISTWDSEVTIFTERGAYPQPFFIGNTLYMFHRYDEGTNPGDFPRAIEYINSTDWGSTWSARTKIAQQGTDTNPYYVSVKGSDNSIHVCWMNNRHTSYSDNSMWGIYYMYSTDNGSTWTKRDGTSITLPANETTADIIWAKGTNNLNSVWTLDIQLDSSNNPYILFINGTRTACDENYGTFDYKFAKWTGSAWVNYTVATGANHLLDRGALRVIDSSNFKAYLTLGGQSNEDGGEIQEYTSTNGGVDWSKTKDITSNSNNIEHNYPVTVVDGQNDLQMIWGFGDSNPTNVYGWGESETFTQTKGSIGDVPDGWTEHNSSAATFRVISGPKGQFDRISSSSGVSGPVNRKTSKIDTDNDKCIEFIVKDEALPSQTYHYIRFKETSASENYGIMLTFKDNGNLDYYDGSWQTLQTYSQNVEYRFKIYNIDFTNNQFDININGINKGTNCGFAAAQSFFEYTILDASGPESYQYMLMDYTFFFIRNYASPEPSTTLGSEEDAPGGTTPVISNVTNGSISATSQWIDWDVNQTAHNRVVYSNESDLTPAWYSNWDNSTAAPNITLSGLDANTQYWYQAWSYNTTNNSLNDNSSTLSFTTTAGANPTLHIDNAINIKEDWGRDFNSNLSANVTTANASNVWMNFTNAEFTNTSLGWLNLTLDEWVNESHNVNSPVTNISVNVYLNASGATNDTNSFWYEVTKRTNTANMDSPGTQSVNQSEDFWINTSVNEEYTDTFYGSADLLEDFNIIATNASIVNYVNFTHNESADGYYHYRVRFYNLTHYENVTTTYSNVTANDAPAAPTGLHNTSYNHSSISTDWDDNAEPDIAGYKLYRNESLAYNGSNSEHYDSGLNPDTLYQYKVQAYDTYGKYGVNCSVVNMSTMQTNYPPPDPINLANNTGNFWINHTWNAGSGYVTDSYNVSIGAVWYNTTTTTYYNDSGLSAHAWSNVTVWAYNSSGPGSLSFGSISDDVRIPNNVPVLSGLPDNTTTEDVNQTDIFDLDDYFTDADGDTPTYQVESNNQSAYVSVTINASNNVSYTLASGWNGTAEVVINVTDGWDSEDNDTFLIIVNAPPLPGDYIPGDPTTLQNTTGNYWVNYTWIVGGGNVTDSYNVSWNLTWYNNTLVPYMNDSVGAEGWANITVSAYNSSGNGSLSAGYISDEVQAPTAPPGDYPPATPTTLANTTGNGWVNYTWNSGGGANVTDSYNVSWNLTWYNTTIVAYMNDSVGEFGWANISVWAYNTSGNGSLSPGSVSDNTQAGGGTYITSMTTTVYNLITYYGSSSSSAEQFGIDIGSVDYIAMYNGSFYTHSMGYIGYNFTTVHGIGYYVYLNATGSSTYSRNNISDTPYNTQLFNRWNTVGWTNATDTNAEGVASSIGSACKYTSSLNADGITYATHTVGFTSNNHAVEKGEGYWVWVNTGVSWGRNN